MKLLLDQGLPHGAVNTLRTRGIDAVHVSELGMASAADSAILELARRDGRTVVTLDADFHTLMALSTQSSPSVIRIRVEKLRAEPLAELLIKVMQQAESVLHSGAMVTVQLGRVRIRRLPLGASELPTGKSPE